MSRAILQTNEYDRFLEAVSAAKHRVLLLDYEGTLARLRTVREFAFPCASIPHLLRRIMARTRLIMVSGRSAGEVRSLLGLNPPPEIWGTQGLERLCSDGTYEAPLLTKEASLALAQAEDQLRRERLMHLVETRPGALSLHWKALPATEILEIRRKIFNVLGPLALRTGLLLVEFDGGINIHLRSPSKADVVRTILAEVERDVPVAYLGNDTTDENAFRALNGRGLTVLISTRYRFTAAQVWLKPPEELAQFLTAWINASGAGL
jgi:trehalose 6-phosphate phosphatase